MTSVRSFIWLAVALWFVACGGKGANTGGADEGNVDLDGDPIALLPSGPVLLANVDARAFYTSGSAGSQLAQTVERLIPLGDESGFQASRDVDRVVLGAYTMSGLDVAAVVRGRFDEAKIAQAAHSNTITKLGAPIVASQYSGRTLYTIANTGFTILTAGTAVAGTESGIRRTLERIADKKATSRGCAPWMAQTLATKNAPLAVAIDFNDSPVAKAAVGSFDVVWLKGMKVARIIGNFEPPGMHVAGTLTYSDPAQAQSAADGIRSADGFVKLVSLIVPGIPKLQNLDVSVEGNDVRGKFQVDDAELKGLVAMLSGWIPQK